jgi:hypothetical protein
LLLAFACEEMASVRIGYVAWVRGETQSPIIFLLSAFLTFPTFPTFRPSVLPLSYQ